MPFTSVTIHIHCYLPKASLWGVGGSCYFVFLGTSRSISAFYFFFYCLLTADFVCSVPCLSASGLLCWKSVVFISIGLCASLLYSPNAFLHSFCLFILIMFGFLVVCYFAIHPSNHKINSVSAYEDIQSFICQFWALILLLPWVAGSWSLD